MKRLFSNIVIADYVVAGLVSAVGIYFLTVGDWSTAIWWLIGGSIGFAAAWLRPAEKIHKALQNRLVRRA
ncbi:hypothetical protein TK90_2853 (plasmid) [Thioalkalivibrio sp. K90mix]|uniref:hypothetical protein n=1 Tax=Thioalkalivibrio sp. (strain K90mix) TaxID=396595 RepID=UPI000195A8C8|nr:hypothetical protein [Thioalkalivibrio sp. K90mix]ADC73337.1 hypothetical protein TK90_2853 [Thioalkalivibrio sp. K90mix]